MEGTPAVGAGYAKYMEGCVAIINGVTAKRVQRSWRREPEDDEIISPTYTSGTSTGKVSN